MDSLAVAPEAAVVLAARVEASEGAEKNPLSFSSSCCSRWIGLLERLSGSKSFERRCPMKVTIATMALHRIRR